MTTETTILPNVGRSGLQALANAVLAPKDHAKLDDLLSRNSEGRLTESETTRLDSLIEQIDELNLLKARAEFTLRVQESTGQR
jgi:predicted Fe-Mo cluster-binding NifX family protein